MHPLQILSSPFLSAVIIFCLVNIYHFAPLTSYKEFNLTFNANDYYSKITSKNFTHQKQIFNLNASSYHLINVSSIFHSKSIKFGDSSFVVVGIHSYEQNISFCHTSPTKTWLVLTGINFGIVITNPNQTLFCLYNPNQQNLNVLINVNVYSDVYPIPGGCNIEFPLEISPFIYFRQTDNLLVDYLEFQRSSLGNETNIKRMCGPLNRKRINYEIYAYYTDDDYTEDNYFNVLVSMSSRTWLKLHSTLVKKITNESQSFRLYFTSNLNQHIYFNILTQDTGLTTTELDEYESLYTPIQTISQLNYSSHSLLLLTLFLLAILSSVVSIVGHQQFILEVYYFSFLLTFGLSLVLVAKIRFLQNTFYVWIGSIILSMVFASTWTIVCRWSLNLKLALSVHSLVLSSWIAALMFHLFLVIFGTVSIVELHLNLALSLITLAIHISFLLLLDLFWLSAISTSIITVYMMMLPLDLLFNTTLFRLLYNIWIYNHYFDYPIINIVVLTKKDIVTGIIYMLFVLISITWQLWSKIGNLTYGFGCIGLAGGSSFSESPEKNHHRKIRKPNHHHQQKGGSKNKQKMYRCKYCNKVSNSKQMKSNGGRVRTRNSCRRVKRIRSRMIQKQNISKTTNIDNIIDCDEIII